MQPTRSPLSADIVELLTAARNGDADALGLVLDCCRHTLMRAAQLAIPADLSAKIGGSDLIQLTFLEASRDFHQFQGNTQEELLAWLRRLLQNNFANELRHWRNCAKRQVSREVSVDWTDQDEDAHHDPVVSPTPSPCQEVIRKETEGSVRDAMARIPALHRLVLILRHNRDLSHAEVASSLGMTTNAARKLCERALESLRQEMRS